MNLKNESEDFVLRYIRAHSKKILVFINIIYLSYLISLYPLTAEYRSLAHATQSGSVESHCLPECLTTSFDHGAAGILLSLRPIPFGDCLRPEPGDSCTTSSTLVRCSISANRIQCNKIIV